MGLSLDTNCFLAPCNTQLVPSRADRVHLEVYCLSSASYAEALPASLQKRLAILLSSRR